MRSILKKLKDGETVYVETESKKKAIELITDLREQGLLVSYRRK